VQGDERAASCAVAGGREQEDAVHRSVAENPEREDEAYDRVGEPDGVACRWRRAGARASYPIVGFYLRVATIPS